MLFNSASQLTTTPSREARVKLSKLFSDLFGVSGRILAGDVERRNRSGRTRQPGRRSPPMQPRGDGGCPERGAQSAHPARRATAGWLCIRRTRLFGLAALSRKRREDRGQRRVVSAKLKEMIEGLALQKPPLPLAALFRQVQRLSKDLGEKAPSYGTVFSIVRDLGAALVTLAHEGTKAYSNTFELVHRREAERPNAIWQADHTPLDILLLIGMPGIEKRLARYPQFYSRIGFVHEFRTLAAAEIRQLFDHGWMPSGVNLPKQPWDPETVAMIIRMTEGNFRLLNRLLNQLERVLEINALREVTRAAVEAARQSLVIGEA